MLVPLLLAALLAGAAPSTSAAPFAAWGRLLPGDGPGGPPPALCDFGFGFDAATESLIIWNGNPDASAPPDQVRSLSLANSSVGEWQVKTTMPQFGRFGAYDIFDEKRRVLYAFFGDYYNADGVYSSYSGVDIYNFSADSWHTVNVSAAYNAGVGPEPRGWGRLAWMDEQHRKLLVTHGWGIVNRLNDSWSFDTVSLEFTRLNTTGDIPYVMTGFNVAFYNGLVTALFSDWDANDPRASPDGLPSNIMFQLNPVTHVWTAIFPHGDFWPEARTYAVDAQNGPRWFFFGGATYNPDGSYKYFNDLFLYDFRTSKFTQLESRGAAQTGRWSARFAVLPNDRLVLYGGCTNEIFLDELFSLDVETAMRARAVKASGPGLVEVEAGQRAYFTLETRARLDALNYFNVSGLADGEDLCALTDPLSQQLPAGEMWGEVLAWGEGLHFRATAVGEGDCSVYLGHVADLGLGVYNVSFTVKASLMPDVLVSVELDEDCGRQIVGSPFRVALKPGQTAPTSSFAAFESGSETRQLVAGESARVLVTLTDEFGNPVRRGGEAGRIAVKLDDNHISDVHVADLGNGSYVLAFTAPTAQATLSITVDGAHIAGSPFTLSLLPSVQISHLQQNIVWALSGVLGALYLSLAALVIAKRGRPDVRAASPRLMLLMLLGCLMNQVFVAMPARDPTADSCRAMPWLSELSAMTVLLVIATTTWRVAVIFTSKVFRTVVITDGKLLRIICLGLALQAVLLAANTAAQTWRVEERSASGSALQRYKVCEAEGVDALNSVTIAPKYVVLLICVALGHRTRSIPKAYNESGNIAFTVYNFFLVTLMVLLVGGQLSDDPSAAHVLGFVANTWIFLVIALALVGSKVSPFRATAPVAPAQQAAGRRIGAPAASTMTPTASKASRKAHKYQVGSGPDSTPPRTVAFAVRVEEER